MLVWNAPATGLCQLEEFILRKGRSIFAPDLTAAGLVMAWYLHPYAFLADLVGTAAAVIYRKKVTCVFPQGMIASCAPVLMGWFAVRSLSKLGNPAVMRP